MKHRMKVRCVGGPKDGYVTEIEYDDSDIFKPKPPCPPNGEEHTYIRTGHVEPYTGLRLIVYEPLFENPEAGLMNSSDPERFIFTPTGDGYKYPTYEQLNERDKAYARKFFDNDADAAFTFKE